MLQITHIDKATEDIVSFIVKQAGGRVNSIKDTVGDIKPKGKFRLHAQSDLINELSLPDNYSEEQIKSINQRWKVIEKSYLDEAALRIKKNH